MTDLKREISAAGDDVDLAISHCKTLVRMLFETAVSDVSVGDPIERETLDNAGTLIHCIEQELALLEAAHSRLWKAANQATGREATEEGGAS